MRARIMRKGKFGAISLVFALIALIVFFKCKFKLIIYINNY